MIYKNNYISISLNFKRLFFDFFKLQPEKYNFSNLKTLLINIYYYYYYYYSYIFRGTVARL